MDYDTNNNNRPEVRWNGSSYTTTNYRVEDASTPASPAKKPKKKHPVLRAIALILCCTLVGGGAGVGGAYLYNTLNPPKTTIIREDTTPANPVSTATPSPAKTDGAMSLTELFNTWANSCVVITSQVSYTSQSWYGPMTRQGVSSGSGFIISEDGYIVTNYHVIDGAQEIKVTLYDGNDYDATYVGGEQANDVAVLKIDAKGLTPVVLGDSDSLQVGEQVCTIGNALGALSFSQTSGNVSGLGRSVTYSDGTVINMIQTDCTINSGNSGGPLFDSQGRVVGITSAKYSNNGDSSDASIEHIGFAIPINDVKNVITDIMQNGYVVRPYMGIMSPQTVSEDNIQVFGWPHGVYVNSVEEGSCAETAGIRRGDIVTKLGDTEISSVAELTAAKNRFKPGDTTTVEVYRAGETLTVTITFDKSPDPSESTAQQPTDGSGEQSGQNGGEGQYPGNGYGDGGQYDNGGNGYNDFYNDFFNHFFGG